MREPDPDNPPAAGSPPAPEPPSCTAAGAPLRRLIDTLALRRSIVGLLAMVVLVGMGERMADRFLPKYLLALGGGTLAVGWLAGLRNLATALYSLPGGWLAHRLGTKLSLLIFNLISIAGYLVVIFVPAWPAVIGGAILFLSWSAISLPATMELVGKALPKTRRTMGVSMVALVRRFPMALGPVLGGACITLWGLEAGIRISFVAALAMALLSIGLQQALIAADRPDRAAAPGASGSAPEAARAPAGLVQALRRGALRDISPALRQLLISDILIRFCEQIPDAFVVVWCTTNVIARPVSALDFGFLSAIEMATAVLCYVPVAYLADRSGKKPFVLLTFGFFALFPLVLLLCRSFWPLVGAFVLRGLKEFGEPTRKALILDLAPEQRRAMTFGVYYLIRDSVVAVAAFGGALLWEVRPEVNLWVAGAFGVIGTIWFALRGRDLPAKPDPTSA
jgi:MFS family permease